MFYVDPSIDLQLELNRFREDCDNDQFRAETYILRGAVVQEVKFSWERILNLWFHFFFAYIKNYNESFHQSLSNHCFKIIYESGKQHVLCTFTQLDKNLTTSSSNISKLGSSKNLNEKTSYDWQTRKQVEISFLGQLVTTIVN